MGEMAGASSVSSDTPGGGNAEDSSSARPVWALRFHAQSATTASPADRRDRPCETSRHRCATPTAAGDADGCPAIQFS